MGRFAVRSEVAGTVWQVRLEPGVRVAHDDIVIVVDSRDRMVPVFCSDPGTLIDVLVDEGDAVAEGQAIAIIES